MPRRKAKSTPPIAREVEVAIAVTNQHSFKAEARWQRDCAMCGRLGGPFHAHHVIYEQHLKDYGLPKYDTRNSRRVHPDCHGDHHSGSPRKIKTNALTDDNIRYAYDELGERATDYLRRYYDDVAEPDARIAAMEREFAREDEAA